MVTLTLLLVLIPSAYLLADLIDRNDRHIRKQQERKRKRGKGR